MALLGFSGPTEPGVLQSSWWKSEKHVQVLVSTALKIFLPFFPGSAPFSENSGRKGMGLHALNERVKMSAQLDSLIQVLPIIASLQMLSGSHALF